MTIRGNPARSRKLVTAGLIIALLFFLAALYLRTSGISQLLSYVFLALFILQVLLVRMMAVVSGAGYIRLQPSGITILVGLRPVIIEWDNIEKISIGEVRKKPALGIRLKSLEPLRRIVEQIALANEAETGYHFCFDGLSLDKPLSEVNSLLNSFLMDPDLRKGLSADNDRH